MRRTMCTIKFFAKGQESLRVLVVAVNIAEQAGQLFESRAIDSAVLLQAVVRTRAELIEIPTGLGDADYGDIQMPPLHHGLQSRKDLLVSQITSCTEEDQGIRMQVAHE